MSIARGARRGMSNVQVPMPKEIPMTKLPIRSLGIGIYLVIGHWSLVIGHGHWSLGIHGSRRFIRSLRRFRPASRQIAHNLNILKDAALPRTVQLDPLRHGRDAFFK